MKAGRYVQAAKATMLSAAVVLSGLAGVGPAAATHLRCGSVITTDTTLIHSIKGCTSRGLYIGADNITLNLGGFVVAGVYTGFNTYGIDTNGHSGVTVINGIVKNFTRGLYISGGRNNTVRAITADDNSFGVDLIDTTNTTVASSRLVNGDQGVRILDGGSNSVLDNKISNNGYRGIYVDFGNDHVIQRNKITYNQGDGVYTLRSITVSDNTVSNNSGGGIVQSTHGPAAPLNITGNLVCNNARGGIRMSYEGNTIISNNVGAGTTGCLRNGSASGYDLFDREAATEEPQDLLFECRSIWRNNYTEGDTFNHPCVTK